MVAKYYKCNRLNPCFGGRCGGTLVKKNADGKCFFSGLNPCFGGRCGGTRDLRLHKQQKLAVLILVLVEDVGGLLAEHIDAGETSMCLNPCFGGRCGGTN